MDFNRFTKKNILFNLAGVILFLLWNITAGGLRSDHFIIIVFWLFTYYFSNGSRRFILGFSIFIVYWIVYDSMRIIPNYEVAPVHIKQPYELEKLLFGINSTNGLITPNEYFAINHTKFLDFLSGIFYLNWVPVPLAFAVYLFIKNKRLFLEFSLAFLIVNIIGFIIYYIYPAAPPWYVDLYGFNLKLGLPGNSAGMARFDQLTGLNIFANIYNKNANVLAAIPSLHSAYPVIVLYYGLKNRMGKINILFVVFMLGIWFSAVYSSHHYIIDVSLGILLAVFCLVGFNNIIKKAFFDRLLTKWGRVI